MRILYITDSLGGPRKSPEIVSFQQTWAYKVTTAFNDSQVIEPIYLFENGLNAKTLKKNITEKYMLYSPDIIFLQIGIVDCAPRVLTKNQLAVVIRMGFLGKLIHKLISKNYNWLSKKRNISYTSVSEFESSLILLKESFNDTIIFSIAIGKPTISYKKKSPLISERVKTYNTILKKVFKDFYVDPYSNIKLEKLDDIYMSDNHHINSYGHTLVAETIIKYAYKLK